MSIKRFIHPCLFTDEDVIQLDIRERYLLIGIITHADDEGRISGAPAAVKAKVFGADSISNDEIKEMLYNISKTLRSFIWYEIDGKQYIQLKNWTKYQSPHYKKASCIPAFNPDTSHICGTHDAYIPHIRRISESKLPQGSGLGSGSGSGEGSGEGSGQGTGSCKQDLAQVVSTDVLPYSEICDYLNSRAHTEFRPNGEKFKELVRARFKDGYTLDDFKRVIDKKTHEWYGDPKFHKYLRPATLFGREKFEQYVGQADIVEQPIISDEDRNNKITSMQSRLRHGVPIDGGMGIKPPEKRLPAPMPKDLDKGMLDLVGSLTDGFKAE
jgi:uncharacterized phage protein (TIGR02220 family)